MWKGKLERNEKEWLYIVCTYTCKKKCKIEEKKIEVKKMKNQRESTLELKKPKTKLESMC